MHVADYIHKLSERKTARERETEGKRQEENTFKTIKKHSSKMRSCLNLLCPKWQHKHIHTQKVVKVVKE